MGVITQNGRVVLVNNKTLSYEDVGSLTLEALNVTSNGTYTPNVGTAYNSVSVAIPSGTAGTPTATKGAVNNHSVSITPSVTNTTGYITGSTKTGTAVSVSASELVSGTKSITANGTGIDVTNYASVNVAVPTGSTISNQNKTVTPSELQQSITADSGYTGLGTVTVEAISSTYVGSGITSRSSTDLTTSGATVTVPAGYYSAQATKSVSTMTLPTSASATSSGTSKATISRSTSAQYINIPTGYNSTAAYYKINAVANGTAGTPTAEKGTVSNNSISITPSVTNTTGYITGSTKTGTAVTVTASELASGNKEITSNGTNIDVVGYSTVSVAVSDSSGGSSSEVEEKDVNFIDYDGTILYSYTKTEFNNLSTLPANPSHTGLTAQGWNWTLAQIKAQLTAMPNDPVWVGQMYITQSGNTEIDVWFHDVNRLSPILTIAVSGTVTVDWGDGTNPETVTGTSLSTRQAVLHTYESTGRYTMVIHVVSGSFTFYGGSDYTLLRKNTTSGENRVYANCVQAIRLGSGITNIGSSAFYYCYNLTSITIPSSITSIAGSVFTYCYSLASVTIPSSVTSIGNSEFSNCSSLASVTIPSGVTSIGGSTFSSCYSLASITIPSGVTSIGSSAFMYCYNLASITIPSGVTSINDQTFRYCPSLGSITIPSGVTSIGALAFNSCNGLGKLRFKPTTPPAVSNSNAFSNITTDYIISVPTGKLSDYTGASNYPDSNTYTYVEE